MVNLGEWKMIVTATEVKARGAALFEELLQKWDEVVIQVRGKPRFVVVDAERYERLRELELDAALREVQADVEAGEYTTDMDAHFSTLREALKEHV